MALTVTEVRGLADAATAKAGKPDLLRVDSVETRESPFLAHSDMIAPAEDRVAPATSLAAAKIESSISRVVLMN